MPSRLCLVAITAIAGLLVGCVSTPDPTGSADAASATPAASAAPSVTATSSQPADGSANPTPMPDPALIELEVTGCPGGVVLEWTPSTHRNFHHYTALRSPESEVSPAYPPIAPAVDWGETYATDPFVTSAVDGSILPSSRTWHYRVMAYDILGDVVSASPVRSARIGRVTDLGTPDVSAAEGDATRIAWEPFTGFSGCFSTYRVMFGIGRAPNTVLSIVSDQLAGAIETDALHAGTTYQLSIEAIRATTLGDIVVGRSGTVVYTAP
jgi:hypothetical protein